MHQDGINYSQIHLYQNTSNKYDTHIIHKYVDGRARGSYVCVCVGGEGVGLRNDVSSRGSLSQRRRGETRVGTPP